MCQPLLAVRLLRAGATDAARFPSAIDAKTIDVVCDDLGSLDTRLPLSDASRSAMTEAGAALAKKQILLTHEQLEVCFWVCVSVRKCERECVRLSVCCR